MSSAAVSPSKGPPPLCAWLTCLLPLSPLGKQRCSLQAGTDEPCFFLPHLSTRPWKRCSWLSPFSSLLRKQMIKEKTNGDSFYIFTENGHRRATFPSQWLSSGASQALRLSDQCHWTLPSLSQRLRQSSAWCLLCNGDKQEWGHLPGTLSAYVETENAPGTFYRALAGVDLSKHFTQ